MSFLTKFRIPTILGLLLIMGGITGAVYLVLQNQTFQTKASANFTPQNIEVTNIRDSGFSLSWQTSQPTIGFLIITIDGLDQTILDDRDTTVPKPRLLHHVSIKNLTPLTTYQYRIISGKLKLPPSQIITASAEEANNNNPIIGQVLSTSGYLQNGLVFLEVAGAIKQSAVIKDYGNFIIPINYIRVDGQTIGKITIIDESSQKTNIIFYLKNALPLVQAGSSVDLTPNPPIPRETVSKFDLNGDGQINSSDYAIVLKNQVDLNEDGVVNQKDLKLMQEQINQ